MIDLSNTIGPLNSAVSEVRGRRSDDRRLILDLLQAAFQHYAVELATFKKSEQDRDMMLGASLQLKRLVEVLSSDEKDHVSVLIT